MRQADLEHAAHLIAADPVPLDDPTLRDRVCDLASLANRTYAETLRAIDAFDRRGLSSEDGFKTTKTWLVGALGISGPAAARLVAAARLLRELPKLAAVVHTGDVSGEHVQQVLLGVATLAEPGYLIEVDAIAVDS